MAGENTIDIRLVDATPDRPGSPSGAPPGFQPPTQAGYQPSYIQNGAGSAASVAQRAHEEQISRAAEITEANEKAERRRRGMEAAAARSAADTMEMFANAGAKAAGAMAALRLASDTLVTHFNQVAYSINKATEASVARAGNNETAARRAEMEERFNRWASNAKVGMTTGGAAAGAAGGFLFGGPIGAGIGALLGAGIGGGAGKITADQIEAQGRIRLAEFDQYAKNAPALRDRGQNLARYDSGLAQQFAQGQVNQVRRDIGEASIIGGALRDVEAKQQQLDRLDQQLGILAKIKESNQQLERINTEMVDRQKALEEAMKDLPEEMKKKLRELDQQTGDPFDELLKKNNPPGGARLAERERGLAKKDMLARQNMPIMGR